MAGGHIVKRKVFGMYDILIVDREPKLSSVLRDYLCRAGFTAYLAGDVADIVPCVERYEPRLILLDMPPDWGDFPDICEEIRALSPVPIIVMTVSHDKADYWHGLGLGAVEYICKPFSPRQVVDKVREVVSPPRAD